MQPESNSGLRTWQWVVTAIVVIILIVVGIFVFSGKGSSTQAPSDTMATSTAGTTAVGANSIVISDQYPGNVVYISSVQLAAPGWVAIHADNKGQPGAIIGTAWAAAGINPVKVTVSQPIVDGGTYYAMLHSDNGDQKFSAATDLPLQDSNGNIIMRVFHGSAAAGNSVKG